MFRSWPTLTKYFLLDNSPANDISPRVVFRLPYSSPVRLPSGPMSPMSSGECPPSSVSPTGKDWDMDYPDLLPVLDDPSSVRKVSSSDDLGRR